MVVSTVCCIGAGDIGILTCIIIASKCPEIRVTVVDKTQVIAEWNTDPLPIFDQELEDIVKKCRNRNLFFNSDYANAIRDSEVIFVSIKAPVKCKGVGEEKSIDFKQIESTAKMITMYAESKKVVVEKSMTPAKVAEKICSVIEATCEPGIKIDVLSNPEFLTERSTVQSLLHPNRVLIGCSKTPNGKAAARVLSELYERWVPQKNIFFVNTVAAEEIKLVGTALLVQHICSTISLTKICEETGADIDEIKKFVGLEPDKKIHGDVRNLLNIYDCLKLSEICGYWQSIQDVQKIQENTFLERIKPVRGKKIAILGITSKSVDSRCENPTPVETCKWLLNEQGIVSIYDPDLQKKQIVRLLNVENINETDSLVTIHDDPSKATDGASIIILFTRFPDFSSLDFSKIFRHMKSPKTFFSAFKILEEEELKKVGFQFENLWAVEKLKCNFQSPSPPPPSNVDSEIKLI